MEAFNFELKLISDVDRIANRGTDSLKKLEGGAKKTREALNFSRPLEKIEAQLHKLDKDPAGFIKMKKAAKELQEQQKKLLEGAGLAKGEGFLSAMTSKLSFTKLASAAAVGDIVGEGIMKAGELMLESAHKFVEIVTEGVAKAFEASGHEEKTRLQYKLSLGDKEGKDSLEDAERFSKLTKFTPEQIAPTMLGLRRAGFEQKSARSIFATGTDIEAAGGMSTGEYAEFAEHLKLKGGVSTKQLVSARVNAPQFYKDLGKKLGISSEAAEKRASEGGKIDPQLLLNMIQQSTEKRQGGAAGTGGIADSQRIESRLEKVKALPDQFLKKLVDSPGFAHAEEMLVGLLEKLDPESPAGKRIQAAIESMFEKITGLIGDPEDAAENLSSTVENTVHLFGEAVDAAMALSDALVPSLNTIEDMVIGMREFIAAQSGDKEGLRAAMQQEVDVNRRRLASKFEKENKKAAKDQAQKVSDHADDNGALLAAPTDLSSRILAAQQGSNVISDKPAPGEQPKGKGGTVIHMHPGAVVVNAAPGEKPSDTHRRAGEETKRHVQNALEDAAQQGGG